MNIQSAHNVSEFVHVLARDSEGRPTRFLVPGHKGRRYKVILRRNGWLEANCEQLFVSHSVDSYPGRHCKGNQRCVCYHVLAACIVSASEQGKELSWCESQADAERLSNIEGKVFTVKSAQSDKVAYGVVRDSKPNVPVTLRPFHPLSKDTLIKVAVDRFSDKEQWYSGEVHWLSDDAFLKNDDGFVRLYRSDKSGKYPKVTRLATVFWLDPGNIEAGWQRYTEAQQAKEELFSP